MHNLCLISIIFFQEIRFVFNKYLDCHRALCDTISTGGNNLMFSNGKSLASFFPSAQIAISITNLHNSIRKIAGNRQSYPYKNRIIISENNYGDLGFFSYPACKVFSRLQRHVCQLPHDRWLVLYPLKNACSGSTPG